MLNISKYWNGYFRLVDEFLNQEYTVENKGDNERWQSDNFYDLQTRLHYSRVSFMDNLKQIRHVGAKLQEKHDNGTYSEGQFTIERRIITNRADVIMFENIVDAHKNIIRTMGLEKALELLEGACNDISVHVHNDEYPLYWK